jgi:hypothetical protein
MFQRQGWTRRPRLSGSSPCTGPFACRLFSRGPTNSADRDFPQLRFPPVEHRGTRQAFRDRLCPERLAPVKLSGQRSLKRSLTSGVGWNTAWCEIPS